MEMFNKLRKLSYWRYIRWLGFCGFFLSPPIGIWYVRSKMKQMEKGIHDDLLRIRNKGKTVGDIPRKHD